MSDLDLDAIERQLTDDLTDLDVTTGRALLAEVRAHRRAHESIRARADAGLVEERDELRATMERVAELPGRWRADARRMGLAAGESPRPMDYSEGHYVGTMKARRAAADALDAALRGESS